MPVWFWIVYAFCAGVFVGEMLMAIVIDKTEAQRRVDTGQE